VAVGKDKRITLPRMCATNANIIHIAGGNLPPCRDLRRLFAIFNKRAIIDLMTMKRHVQVGAVTLRGGGEGRGGGGGTEARNQFEPRVHEKTKSLRVYSCSSLLLAP
jgi:hypothetical protein